MARQLAVLLLVVASLVVASLAVACGDEPPAATPSPSVGVVSTAPQPTAEPETTSTPAANPEPTATPTATPTPALLPIVDLHFHPDAAWNIEELVALMDELGVVMAIGGAGDSGVEALRFAAAYPDRFVPFAGQDGMRALNLIQGAPSWELQSKEAQDYVAGLEEQLQAGCWSGIGEAFVNTLGSHVSGGFSVPADSPLMQRLLTLAAQYDAPLSVHMDAAPASVEQLKTLLDSNPDGALIWAHAGWYATPAQLRELLQAHANLTIELSFRDELRSFFPVTGEGVLLEDWRGLLEEMPDRFVLGTDLNPPPTPQKYAELVRFWRGVLDQLSPEAASKIANENAMRLVDETRVTDPASCAAGLGE
jgi:hypothetical protein